MTETTEPVRNVVNQDDIKKFIKKVSKRSEGDTATWLQTVLRKYLINAHDDTAPYRVTTKSPEWAQVAKERGDDLVKVSMSDEFVASIDHLVDYLNQSDACDITRISWDQANQQAKEWIQNLNKKEQSSLEIAEAREGEEVVVQYENGYRAVKLISKSAYVREGTRMKHCIGGHGYYEQSKSNPGNMALSLRDETDYPHITFFVKNNKISEMRQSCNRVVRERYTKYILKIMNTLGVTYGGSYWQAGQDHIHHTVDGQQYMYEDIPDGAHLKGNISIIGAIVTRFPDNLIIEGNLNISYTSLTEFPNCIVKRGVYVSGTEITTLPEMECFGNCDITDSGIIELPQNSIFHGNVITGRKGVAVPKSTKVLGKIR